MSGSQIQAATGTSHSACCDPIFTSSVENKAGEPTREDALKWGETLSPAGRTPHTTGCSLSKPLEIQSKAKLVQDALMEGQAIYKRRLINGKGCRCDTRTNEKFK